MKIAVEGYQWRRREDAQLSFASAHFIAGWVRDAHNRKPKKLPRLAAVLAPFKHPRTGPPETPAQLRRSIIGANSLAGGAVRIVPKGSIKAGMKLWPA